MRPSLPQAVAVEDEERPVAQQRQGVLHAAAGLEQPLFAHDARAAAEMRRDLLAEVMDVDHDVAARRARRAAPSRGRASSARRRGSAAWASTSVSGRMRSPRPAARIIAVRITRPRCAARAAAAWRSTQRRSGSSAACSSARSNIRQTRGRCCRYSGLPSRSQQPDEQADDAGVALRRHQREAGAEILGWQAGGGEVARQAGAMDGSRHVAPRVLDQRHQVVGGMAALGVLEVEQAAGAHARSLGQPQQIVLVVVAQQQRAGIGRQRRRGRPARRRGSSSVCSSLVGRPVASGRYHSGISIAASISASPS